VDEGVPIQRIRRALHSPQTFVQLVLTDVGAAGGGPAYEKIVVRPSPAGNVAAMQVDFFTTDKHITRHITVDDTAGLLSLPFARAHLQTTDGDLHIRVTRKGNVLCSEGRPSVPQRPHPRAHDRAKRHHLPADRPSPLLQALGIQTRAGKVRSARRAKFHQINQFLEILLSLDELREPRGTLHIMDCGCGAAYLTFAAHHYLRDVLKLDARTIGIDVKEELVARCNALRDRLNYTGLTFVRSTIGEFVPPAVPDVVLSLHACDTATDEAIALGIRHRARTILAAPCCQHELRDQIRHDAMNAVLRHGVLKGRLADIITDAARAAVLRLKGYRCDVIEFVSPEHTSKNLLLRAERRSSRPLPGAEEDYAALKAAWHIAPTLERLTDTAVDPRHP